MIHSTVTLRDQPAEPSLLLERNVRMYAGPGGNRGAFTAWDPVTGKPRWEIKEFFPA